MAVVCLDWILTAVTAAKVGHHGSLAIVVPQVVVLAPLLIGLVYATALRMRGSGFAGWASLVWVGIPYMGYAYATPSLRHDYAHMFLPRALGLVDDPRYAAMLAFAAAMFFALRAVDNDADADAALAAAAAAAGAALAPREAVAALVPVVGLAFAGRTRGTLIAAGVLAVLLGAVGGAVAGGRISGPFARVGIHAPFTTLSSLSENFWSGRVLQWLAIAGAAGAARARVTAGVMIGLCLAAAFLSLPMKSLALSRNLSVLYAALPVLPAVAMAVAAIPLLLPRSGTVGVPVESEQRW